MDAEEEDGDEVEEGGPDDGLLRGEDPGGDDGGHGVGRIVHPVEKIEEEGEGDDGDD